MLYLFLIVSTDCSNAQAFHQDAEAWKAAMYKLVSCMRTLERPEKRYNAGAL
jgi:hypothetical protein